MADATVPAPRGHSPDGPSRSAHIPSPPSHAEALECRPGSVGRSLLRRLARGALLALAIQVAGAGLSYLSQLALARWMGLTQFGTYTYLIAWATVAGLLAALGFPISVLRLIPEYRTRGQSEHLRGLLRVSRAAPLATGFALVALGSVLVVILDPPMGAAVLLALWLIPLGALINVDLAIVRAGGRVLLAYTPSQVLRPLLILLASGAVWLQVGHLSATIALGLTLAAFVLVALSQVYLVRRVRADARSQRPNAYERRRWLAISAPLLLVAGFQIVLSQTDVLLVGSVVGARDAGLYSAAARTAGLAGYLLIALLAIATPQFAELHANGNGDGLQRMSSFCAQCVFWPTLLLVVMLAISASHLLALFGPGFAAAHAALLILLIGQLVNAACGAVGALLNMTGHQRQVARVYGIVCAANLGGCYLLVRAFGLNGAAAATTLSLIAWNLWLHRLTRKLIGVRASIVSALRMRIASRGAPGI